jgi:hypothetical protein
VFIWAKIMSERASEREKGVRIDRPPHVSLNQNRGTHAALRRGCWHCRALPEAAAVRKGAARACMIFASSLSLLPWLLELLFSREQRTRRCRVANEPSLNLSCVSHTSFRPFTPHLHQSDPAARRIPGADTETNHIFLVGLSIVNFDPGKIVSHSCDVILVQNISCLAIQIVSKYAICLLFLA